MERIYFLMISTVQAFETEYQELKRSLFSGRLSPLPDTITISDARTLTLSSITLDRYHIHRDFTGFAYNIILVRSEVLRNSLERCILKVSLLTVQLRPHTGPVFRHIYPSPSLTSTQTISSPTYSSVPPLKCPKATPAS